MQSRGYVYAHINCSGNEKLTYIYSVDYNGGSLNYELWSTLAN